MSEEHKRKIGEANRISLKGKHCSPKTEFKKGLIPKYKGKKMEFVRGENSPSYRHGLYIKQRICEEGGKNMKQCQICKEFPKRTIIHHINGNEFDNRLQNLSVLCYFCHNAIHDTPSKISNRFQLNHPLGKHS